MKEQKTTIWIPQKEYLLMKEMNDAMSPIQKMRMSYFFWNNFSMEKWDEYLALQVLKSEEENKPLITIKKRVINGR